MGKRTVFIGDIHGCLDELLELMGKINPTPSDRIIFLGDLINRGPDSVGVVKYVHGNHYECVMGNNEVRYIHQHSGNPVYQSYRAGLSDAEHDWLINLPYYIEDIDFIAVHAWLAPWLHPDQTDPAILCKIKTWSIADNAMGNDMNPAWHTFYTADKKVFYGHWRSQWLLIKENTIGLDSWCVCGWKLSAYVLESRELIQVSAKKEYVPAL